MRWLGVFGMCVVLMAGSPAESGVVRTLDGRTLPGGISIAEGSLAVASTNGTVETITLNNLLAANFDTPGDLVRNSPGGGNGLLGYYFSNTNLDGSVFVRLDESIDFDWSIGEPASRVAADYFGVVWSGELEAPAAGNYTFALQADEGATLVMDGNTVITTRSARVGDETASAPLPLEAGKKHALRLNYFDWTGTARVRLSWAGPGFAKTVIAKEHLHARGLGSNHTANLSSSQGLVATYHGTSEFGGATATRIDPTVDFNWTERDPLPGFSRTNFSVRWSGQVKAGHSEEYTFYVLANERVRLWIDGRPLIERFDQLWLSEIKGSLPLVAGEKYDLRLEVQSRTAGATAKLMWSSASVAKTNIPATHLFPSKPSSARAASLDQAGKTPPGLVLRDGSFLAGAVEQATETSVRASSPLLKAPLSTPNVARIVCQPLSRAMEERLVSGRAGVLLARGDFVDGDFKGIQDGRVKIGSILFGTRSFDAKKEVLAVVLHGVVPATAAYEIELLDRSLLHANTVVLERGGVVIRDFVSGALRLPAGDLSSIRRRASAVR